MDARSSDEPARGHGAKAPTVHDVATLAHVSPMTVSRVFSGAKHVRPAMRARVESAALELGYHRNENARSLRPGQKSGLIGVAITNIANPYYAEMLRGIEEVMSRHSRRILVGNTKEDSELERQLVADFIGRQVEGLIVVPAGEGTGHLNPFHLAGVPMVLATREVQGLDVDTVLVDDIGGACEATTILLDEGHQRIAFLGSRGSVFTAQRRFEGFRLAHERLDLVPVDILVRFGQQDVKSAEHAMTELLALAEPPTAVFCANNRNTIGAIRAIHSLVARRAATGSSETWPEGVRLFGFDSFEFADMSPVPLSIVDHDAEELGRRAAEMLIERLDDGGASAAKVIELPVRLRHMF